MYNGTTPTVGGIGALAATGGGDPTLPLVIAIAAVTVGALLFARERLVRRTVSSE